MNSEYLQRALVTFNTDKSQWYGWKKEDDNGNVIPNDQRMTYENIVLNDNTAILPSKADVDAKIAELKQADADKVTARTSAINKIVTAASLTDAEKKALFGE